MKKICLFFLVVALKTHAQELFVYTEPASNMPLGSLGVRLANMLMDEKGSNRYEYHLVPEVMWGVNKRLIIHFENCKIVTTIMAIKIIRNTILQF